MKNLGIRIFAFMLVVWYCLSIIGFGVHTCSESNRSFLTTFISGISCEEIHPSVLCKSPCCSAEKHEKCCCHHSSEEDVESQAIVEFKVGNKTCCNNDYQQITLTGSGLSNISEQSAVPVDMLALCSTLSFDFNDSFYSKIIQARSLPEQGICVGELRPLLSIWRI